MAIFSDDVICNLAKTHQTPFYLYNFDRIRANFKIYQKAFRSSLICYALKANSNLKILKLLASLGAGADCVSGFEIKKALLAGIDPKKIIFSGVGKIRSELKFALENDILFINVESEFELLQLENLSKEMNKKAKISIRVNPNVDAKTHPYISTGLKTSKFGLEESLAKKLFLQARGSKFLEPIGLHFHIGSQILELSPLLEAAQKMRKFALWLAENGIKLQYFDIGGGLGISYDGEKVIDLQEYANHIFEITNGLDVCIICEPGRRIVADCGVLVAEVLGIKESKEKHFVIVDCAMNDLMRPVLYNTTHQFKIIKNLQNTPRSDDSSKNANFLADIVGSVCESSDFLVKNVNTQVQQGDLIAFQDVGAYGFSMSHNYNLRPRAPEIAFENGKFFIIRSRENFAHLLFDEESL